MYQKQLDRCLNIIGAAPDTNGLSNADVQAIKEMYIATLDAIKTDTIKQDLWVSVYTATLIHSDRCDRIEHAKQRATKAVEAFEEQFNADN